MSRFSSLLRERAGNVTVELALVAPILSALLIGLIDLSTAYSDKLRLEQVAQRTVERVMQNSFVASDAETLETEAASEAGTGATADVTFWLECNDEIQEGEGAYTAGCADGEQYARYVQVEITRDYTPLIMQTFGASSNEDGTMTVTGIAGIRIQ